MNKVKMLSLFTLIILTGCSVAPAAQVDTNPIVNSANGTLGKHEQMTSQKSSSSKMMKKLMRSLIANLKRVSKQEVCREKKTAR